MRSLPTCSFTLLVTASLCAQEQHSGESDWRAFRGTDGTGASAVPAPTEWSDDANIRWRTALPGPGSSSPIIIGDSVYVTCWSGIDANNPSGKQLRRHVLRVDRDSGEILWSVDLEPTDNEDPYAGILTNHGFATGTPVSDGERLYVFFGKAGVYAFDLMGKELWHSQVGSGSGKAKTGSASSLALSGGRLFINASDESEAVVALDAETGTQLWSRSFPAVDQAYDTPVVTRGEEPVVLFAMLKSVWGLSPETGESVWTVKTETNSVVASSIIVDQDVAYSFGGLRGKRSYAIRLGGKGDVTESHTLWSSRNGSYISTPLLFDGHLYWVEKGIAFCAKADSGALVYRERIEGSFYASLVRAGDALYAVTRTNGTYVYAASPEFELFSHNKIDSDESEFHATPALSRGQLFLRSDRFLYCVDK